MAEEQENENIEETPPVEESATETPEPAPEAPVRDSGPVEGAPGEPGGSPGEREVAAEETSPEAPTAGDASAPPEPKKKRKRLARAQRPPRSKPRRERPAERKPLTRLPKPESVRARRQERRGVVVSDAMDKTIVVKVDTIKAHPRYKKVVRRSVKFRAHDERNEAKVGDVVLIVETRPLSKTKNWRLAQVLEAAR